MCSVDSGLQRSLGWIHSAFLFLVEAHHHEVGVGLAHQFHHHLVHSLHREHRHDLVHHLIFCFNSGERFLFKIVACAHAAEAVA